MKSILSDLRARGFRIHALPGGVFYVYGFWPSYVTAHALEVLHASGARRERA
jgi:hypothetical protein